MDMITKIELEDAVCNDKKVRDRVEEVARIVGDMEDEFRLLNKEYTSKYWILERFYYDFRDEYSENMKHLINSQINAIMSLTYYDDEDIMHDIKRYIKFPKYYLFSEDWLPRAQAMAKRHKATWAKIHAESLEKSIADKTNTIKENLKLLKKLKIESIGWDDVID